MGKRLTIVLFTYERTDYARETLIALAPKLHVAYPLETRLHIADDGSRPEHREELRELGERWFPGRVTISNSERGGYGANYNAATMIVHELSDYVLAIEDDWELTRPLDVDDLIEDMQAEPRIGCLRLGYIGYTQPLRAEFMEVRGKHYLALDPESPEPHVFSGHPRLESVAWQRDVGLWPEGLSPGATEFEVAHRPEARTDVAWPIDLIPPRGGLFNHIGSIRSEDIGEPLHAR